MYKGWETHEALPYITGVSHGPEGLVVQYSQGTRVFYQTGLLWEMRDYDADVPAEMMRGLMDSPRLLD